MIGFLSSASIRCISICRQEPVRLGLPAALINAVIGCRLVSRSSFQKRLTRFNKGTHRVSPFKRGNFPPSGCIKLGVGVVALKREPSVEIPKRIAKGCPRIGSDKIYYVNYKQSPLSEAFTPSLPVYYLAQQVGSVTCRTRPARRSGGAFPDPWV